MTLMEIIDNLTEQERDVFGKIAINYSQGHDPEVLKALYDKELIELNDFNDYFVPIYVHIHWCEWCSLHYEEEN